MAIPSPPLLKGVEIGMVAVCVVGDARRAVWCDAVAGNVTQMSLHGPRRGRSQDHEPRLDDDPARLRLEPVAGEPGRDLAPAQRVITPTAASPQAPADVAHFGNGVRQDSCRIIA
jgi:hypothetical protein